MTKIVVVGCLGRMGSAVCRLADTNPKIEIVAGVDTLPPAGGLTYPIFSDINQCQNSIDVAVCFLPPSATTDIESLIEYCEIRQIPLVLCTTGLSGNMHERIKQSAKKVAILQSANMSLGINILTDMLTRATKLLYDADFDIEIIEKHHNQKLDAPSGTAYLLADTINNAIDENITYVHDRSRSYEKRNKSEVGLHAVRGGTIVGEHTIIFAGQDEVIELKHSALSRDVFAVGAINASIFLHGKPAGLYGMQDLINSKGGNNELS